ncbi:MAG TPA: ABC transporter ATP-binding protein [Saprospiraceae bacterium]|nr:ABC transporter ATP-binding protein [Saprospiraceae bacterium]HMQ84328.1 ABC transporter ATP-binding protein [Saprospiraceae bacterium]
MIEAAALSKKFGSFKAVQDVSFKLKKGETLALIGKSGCGKTTTLKMLNRLIHPSSGHVFIDGANILNIPVEELRRQMGYVIQHIGLFPHYTVYENVALVPRLLKWPESKIKNRVEELLEQLGLPCDQYLHKYPREMSGGQQQRVGIARALAAHPPIILMDEPFGALDAMTRVQMRMDMMMLKEFRDKTIILVTHDLEEALEMSQWVAVMDQGRVEQLGTPEEIIFQPKTDFVRSFVAVKAMKYELEAPRLSDVFADLSILKPAEGTILQFPPHTPLLKVLHALWKAEGQQVYGFATWYGVGKWFSFDDIFHHFKQSLVEWNS